MSHLPFYDERTGETEDEQDHQPGVLDCEERKRHSRQHRRDSQQNHYYHILILFHITSNQL